MFRSLRELPGIVADYTVGTVIVLAQLALHGRARARDLIRHEQRQIETGSR